jgi:hypothetical protein
VTSKKSGPSNTVKGDFTEKEFDDEIASRSPKTN